LQNIKDGCLVTLLVHSSGQYMELAPVHIPPTDGSPQALGSILTYCSRYSYKTALNLATDDDDDGGAAAGHETQTLKEPPKPAQVPPKLLADAQASAEAGTASYKAFYSMLTAQQRGQLAPKHEEFKKIAAAVKEAA